MAMRLLSILTFALVLGGCGIGDNISLPNQAAQSNTSSIVQPSTTLTYTFDGTLGPVLAGSDPIGFNGKKGILTLKLSSTAKPVAGTSTFATYRVPAGSLVLASGASRFSNVRAGTVKFTFPASGPDTMVMSAPFSAEGTTFTTVGTASLANASFTPALIKAHPTLFAPTPQTLTAAKSAKGPGSKLLYRVLGTTTVLGFAGKATCI